jgi:hypothetical protein
MDERFSVRDVGVPGSNPGSPTTDFVRNLAGPETWAEYALEIDDSLLAQMKAP